MAGSYDYSEINRILQIIAGNGITATFSNGASDGQGTDLSATIDMSGSYTGTLAVTNLTATSVTGTAAITALNSTNTGPSAGMLSTVLGGSLAFSGLGRLVVTGGAWSDLTTGVIAAVAGSAASVPLVAKGAGSQTGNLQEWQDSNGTMLSRITALGYFATLGNLYLQADGTSMFFGASSDTNLYRSAADVLKTDDTFIAVGGIQSGGTTYINNVESYSGSVIRVKGPGSGNNIITFATNPNVSAAGFTDTGALDMLEQTEPAAPAANTGRLFVVDSGGGKSVLKIRFPSGASQTIATEP